MTPQQAKERYGATHYQVMKDGVTPQMYYKQVTEKYNDGTFRTRWVYLTFANLWHGSSLSASGIKDLKEIT